MGLENRTNYHRGDSRRREATVQILFCIDLLKIIIRCGVTFIASVPPESTAHKRIDFSWGLTEEKMEARILFFSSFGASRANLAIEQRAVERRGSMWRTAKDISRRCACFFPHIAT